MADKKKPSEKLRPARDGAAGQLRSGREKAAEQKARGPDAKKNAQRRRIRLEASDAKARQKKLRIEPAPKGGGERGAKRSFQNSVGRNASAGRRPVNPNSPIADGLSAMAHDAVSSADKDKNSGTEAAHFVEGTAESALREGSRFRYGRKLKKYRKAEKEALRAGSHDSVSFAERAKGKTVRAQYAGAESGESAGAANTSNPFSRWMQKRSIKRGYAKTKAGAKTVHYSASGVNAAGTGATKAGKVMSGMTDRAFLFVKSHSNILLLLLAAVLLLLVITGSVSSCSVLMNGGGNVILGTSFTAEDADIKGADADYTALESALRAKIDNIESTHSGYDEYRYNLAEIGHNPYELAALLTIEYEDYTRAEVQGRMQGIFDAQYALTLREEVQIRTRTETRTSHHTDPGTGESYSETYEVEVEYEYHILHVTLTNSGINTVAYASGLTDDQMERYRLLLETRGNRDDLFGDVLFATPSGGGSGEYTDYDIPGEALTDERFRRMITEAEKYLGYPYVWGGASPSTSFDCSGFVSWVINHCGNGWNVGRLTANGLMGVCDIIPKSEAKPGDLIFFQGTYNTTGASHVGIYVGNGMMIHCGNPISYASTETAYWQSHYYCMGRIR